MPYIAQTDQTMKDQATLSNTQEAIFPTWPLLTATTVVAKNVSPYRAVLKVDSKGPAEYIEMPPQSEKVFSRRFMGLPVRLMNDSGKFGSMLVVSAL